MKIAPHDLVGRIRSVLHGEPAASLRELDLLVAETFDLIDAHMPQIDMSERRSRYLLV